MKKNIFAMIGIILSIAMILTVVSFALANNEISTVNKGRNAQAETETVAIVDENGEVIYVPENRNEVSNEDEPVIEMLSEKSEIAIVPSQFLYDVKDGESPWIQIASDVLIIHARSEEEAQFLLAIFEIPQYIYDEMSEHKWSLLEQREFVMKMSHAAIDINLAWAECKSGATVDALIAKKEADDRVRSQLLTDFIFDIIDVKEYITKYPMFLESEPADNVTKFATSTKESIQKQWIEQSGLTKAEMDYCRSIGVTKVFDMYNAKSVATVNKIPFETVASTKKNSVDWDETEAKLFNRPVEEIRTEKNALRGEMR